MISASPGVLQPVFDSMLGSAVRICDAKFGVLFRRDGEILRPVAYHGEANGALTSVAEQNFRPHPESNFGRMVATNATVHTPDLKDAPEYRLGVPGPVRLVDEIGIRAVLHVPLVRGGQLIGVFNIYRSEARPYTEKQIELVENFAKQAVIAIENARLLTELRRRTADLTELLDNLRSAQDRLVQTEKLASLGQLTAGIAHEIKNPLNFVNNFSGLSVELIEELEEGALRAGHSTIKDERNLAN